jgi:hypothetical protein
LRRRSTTEAVGPSSLEVRAPFRVFRSKSRALLAQTHPACRSAAPRSSSPTASQHGFESEIATPLVGFPPPSELDPGLPASSSRVRQAVLSSPGQPPMSFCRSSAHTADRVLRGGACHTPPEPARGVSTPSANRPLGHPHCLPGLFRPDNARELSTFRAFSFQRSVTRSRVRSSHAVTRFRASSPRDRLRRFSPLEIGVLGRLFPPGRDSIPSWRSSSLRFSLLPPLKPASRPLPPSPFPSSCDNRGRARRHGALESYRQEAGFTRPHPKALPRHQPL